MANIAEIVAKIRLNADQFDTSSQCIYKIKKVKKYFMKNFKSKNNLYNVIVCLHSKIFLKFFHVFIQRAWSKIDCYRYID